MDFGKEILVPFCDVSVAEDLTARVQIVQRTRIDAKHGNQPIRPLGEVSLRAKILGHFLTLVGRDCLGGIVKVCLDFIFNLF